MAKLARLLNLTAALLESRVPLTAEEIRERIDGYPSGDLAFHRAFERDKDELRELGVPVETVTVGHHEASKAGYTIDERRYSLKDPGFTPEELAALQLARAAVMFEGIAVGEVEGTFRKLGGVEASSEESGAVGSIPLSETMTLLFGAINERRVLAFAYGEALRSVRPLTLEFDRGRWYLGAFDIDREGMRNFRVDRIDGEITSGPPDAFPAENSISTLVTAPWAAGTGDVVTTRILVDKEPAQATLMEYADLRIVEQRDDASVVVEADVRSLSGLYAFMAGLLERAEILEPDSIREGYVEWLSERVAVTNEGREP
ncbi:MAG: WYL domain-containing protein [Microthrixaceae bacterium]|nr:WYL domain-containing protein [Microthrixaceae bacterium]